jgi:hypothetical protein
MKKLLLVIGGALLLGTASVKAQQLDTTRNSVPKQQNSTQGNGSDLYRDQSNSRAGDTTGTGRTLNPGTGITTPSSTDTTLQNRDSINGTMRSPTPRSGMNDGSAPANNTDNLGTTGAGRRKSTTTTPTNPDGTGKQ